ncbi:MAG: hypothetical protein IIT56_05945, partial [Bacteroidales bacterium]|nr:hypothetical protein [Bacteroidales bacterium]
MKVFLYFFLLLTFLTLKTANSQIVRYSNDFLLTGDFSAMEATGGSKTAAVSGSEAVFSNPSNLFFEDYKADFSLMHDNYFSSMANLDLFSAAYQADTSLCLGLSARMALPERPTMTQFSVAARLAMSAYSLRYRRSDLVILPSRESFAAAKP